MMKTQEPTSDLIYTTSPETAMLLMREICRIEKEECDQLLMTEVAKTLQDWGVDFSRAEEPKK